MDIEPEELKDTIVSDNTVDSEIEVKWDGIDDRENAKLLPKALRYVYALIISTSSLCVTSYSSIYSMAVDGIIKDFGHISHTVATLGITLFLLAMGFGPMFLSPISENFGRRIPYIGALLGMVAFSFGTAFANNIATLLVCRFFCGFSGSCFMGVAAGSFADLFDKHEIAIPVMLYTLTPFLGAGLGPLVGGFINQYIDGNGNWRWTFHVMTIYAAVMLVLIVLVVPETYPPILLRKKAIRLRKQTGDSRYYAPIERSKQSLFSAIFLSCERPIKMLIFEPMLTLLCIYTGLLLALLYSFFVSYPYVFRTVYHFSISQVGMAFIGIIVGCSLAGPIALLNKKVVKWQVDRNNGVYQPEFELPQTMLGSVIVPIGLFLFGWLARPSIHWIGPVIGGGTVLFGNVVATNGIFAYTIDVWRQYSASAMACNGVVRSSIAAVFPLFSLQMYEKLGINWASTLLALLCVMYIPMPILFYKYGKKIRSKSKYSVHI